MPKKGRKMQKRLALRQNDYDDNHSTERGWRRPGSQNLKKRLSLSSRKVRRK